MSSVPGELRYTRDHEWVRQETGGTLVVGITEHAQHQLGELVFVELPEAGRTVKAGEACAVVESVKAASDVYAPIAGVITEVNDALNGEPGLVNAAPYTEGWLFRMKPDGALSELLEANAYRELIQAGA
jgi:glycine cleavage system H protein